MATSSSTGSSTLNDHGLIIVPCCANPTWVADHGSPTVDIVAIHGLNGKRWSTWTHKEKGKADVMWLQDLLPDKLPQARVMTFGYNADMINNYSTSNIRDHARKLLSLLRNKRDEGDQASRPIIFVCHSLGGIVAKQALRIATNETPYNSIANSTRGIVFMGTPHRGSDLAFWGNIIAGIAKAAFLNPSKNIKELKNNSSTLMDISEDFRSIVGKYTIVSFYEDTKIKGVSKEVVGKHSAVMEITGEEAIPLAGNHMEICTFSGTDDEGFEEVWKAIKRVIESKPDQNSEAKRALVHRLTQLAQFDHLRFLEKMPSPLDGTCSWILDHPAYRSWLECAGISILHIVGKPGCGKSMISKYLLADSKSRLDWIASGYFSFSATERRQNLIQVYSSFLLQILAFATSMYPRIIEACSAQPKGEWDERDLETLLEEALAIFPHRRVILVLDALDECHAFGSEVLGAIAKLCRKAPWCKVLVTSRPNEGMPRESDVSELNLDKEPGLEGDMKLFIVVGVELLMKTRPFFAPLKSEITKRLNERAEGMFLLVEHIMRSLVNLKGTSRKNIRKILGSLPKTLEDAYAQTFDRVQREDIDFARSVLICLLHAARPMTVPELAIAIAITEETPSFAEMVDDVALSVLYDINTRIGPIITVSNNSVSLIHASLKDFLLSTVDSRLVDRTDFQASLSGDSPSNPRKWYVIDKDDANNDLLCRCMKYFDLWILELAKRRVVAGPISSCQPANSEEQLDTTAIEGEGFVGYAVESLPDHARNVSAVSVGERQRVKSFFESGQFAMWRSCYWAMRDPSRIQEEMDPLAMACLLGLKLTVEDLVSSGDLNGFDDSYLRHESQKALEAVIEGGVVEILAFLIDRGATVDLFIKEAEERTLLSAAVWYGRIEIIRLLLERSNQLHLRNEEKNGYTPIDVAVQAGRQSIVRWLHSLGSPLNLGTDGWYRREFSTLQVAVLSNRSGMIPMLLDLGADIMEHSKNGDLAFHLAAELGDINALRMLKPRNVDETDGDGHTALLRAAKFLQEEAILYLLSEGADINARNSKWDSGSAVHLALTGRKLEEHQKAKEVLELLLHRGFDIPSREDDLEMFFSAAAESDNTVAFSFLMGWPGPLASMALDPNHLWQFAFGSQAFEICNYLLETEEVDINTQDSNGATALHFAARQGNAAFCQKLISSYRMETTIRDNNGRTPLFYMVHNYTEPRHSEVVSILMQPNNEIVNMADNRGLTALHLAAEYRNFQLAKLLLERGAVVDPVGLTTASEEGESSLLKLPAPTLKKNCVEELLGIELATWLISPVTTKRTELILSILQMNYVDLNGAYLPDTKRDLRPRKWRIKLNPFIEAAERGEHVFVKAMLEKQTRTQISREVLDAALRLARKEKHGEVANILAGHIEALASQQD